MDKPISMSVKDYLIRTLAVKMLTSEKTIEAVVNHQFQSANEALETNHSVEISGFGKFLFNNKKAIKKLEALHAKVGAMEKILADDTITEQRRNAATVTLANTHIAINQLKPKLRYD
jgi:nucleoid DNA-binding protein